MNNKKRYQVTVKVELLYDIEVEADSFQDAIEKGQQESGETNLSILDAVGPLVPDGVLGNAEFEIAGVYKL